MSNNVSLYYQNVRGLRTKTRTFFTNMLAYDTDIVALTETWLNKNINTRELFNNNYICYRSDRRDGRRGWGVLVAVYSKWSSVDLTNYNTSHEYLLIKVFNNQFSFFICCVYIPPNSSIDYYKSFFSLLESIVDIASHNIVLLGDFNIPSICGTVSLLGHNIKNNKVLELFNFMSVNNLNSHNNILNIHQRTLDLIFTNFGECLVNRETDPLVEEDSHHPALFIIINCKFLIKNQSKASNSDNYNFKKADFELMYRDLSEINWSDLEKYTCVNRAVDEFYNKLYTILDKHVPKCRYFKNNSNEFVFTQDMKNLQKEKIYHLKKIKCNSGDLAYHLSRYKNARKNLKKLIRVHYKKYLTELEDNICSDPQAFWKHVKNQKKCVASSHFVDINKPLFENSDIANCFSKYFSSVYENIQSNNTIGLPKHVIDNLNVPNKTLEILNISIEEVEWSINKLKPKRSCGPDLIPPYVLKGCVDIISVPLKILFNLSVSTNVFPEKWKVSRVCPVFKSGDKKLFNNYRPVSILSSFAKVFEQIIYQRLFKHVSPCITSMQHGFMPKQSTSTNLLTLTDFIISNMDNGDQTDVIYMDMRKAFDIISHTLLLLCLKIYKLSDLTLNWFESYLGGRRQYVVYEGCRSENYSTPSGVPQGSNLGPLLFLLAVNNIPHFITNSILLMYADDLKIFKVIKNIKDCQLLEQDLKRLLSWSAITGLHFSPAKCKIVSFSRNRNKILYNYTMENSELERATQIKDLGVIFDDRMSFTDHINSLVRECFQKVGLILRMGRNFRQAQTYMTLFNTLVRCKLEYASVVWSPFYIKYIRSIESIQTRFLRIVDFRINGVYPKYESAATLREKYIVSSLETRRKIGSLLFLHKMWNGTMTCPELLTRVYIRVPRIGARKKNKFFADKKARTELSKMSPINRMVLFYNQTLDMDDSVDIFYLRYTEFKNKLQRIFNCNN